MNLAVRDFTHSVMFHHFHGKQHPRRQGSISSDDFERMIDWLTERYNLISSDEYFVKLLGGNISKEDICLSFDDALKCQIDIALPILKERGIRSFFFIYSSPFFDNPDLLEVFSFFRSTQFYCIDDFYEKFFKTVEKHHEATYKNAIKDFNPTTYLSAFSFYTENDRLFRFLRDRVLTKDVYEAINLEMMSDEGFSISEAQESLWMSDDDIRHLDADGHCVGLHSFSHPTELGQLSKASQEQEYSKNYNHLSEILGGKTITTMSHPCGNYDDRTLSVLRDMKIEIGFRSNPAIEDVVSFLEIPREDHIMIIREMNS